MAIMERAFLSKTQRDNLAEKIDRLGIRLCADANKVHSGVSYSEHRIARMETGVYQVQANLYYYDGSPYLITDSGMLTFHMYGDYIDCLTFDGLNINVLLYD